VEFDPKDFDIDLPQKTLADFGKHFAPANRGFGANGAGEILKELKK
jgi:hypothetical protein